MSEEPQSKRIKLDSSLESTNQSNDNKESDIQSGEDTKKISVDSIDINYSIDNYNYDNDDNDDNDGHNGNNIDLEDLYQCPTCGHEYDGNAQCMMTAACLGMEEDHYNELENESDNETSSKED
jgi:hypothetical protein